MTSMTRMQALIKGFRVREIAEGFRLNPDLVRFRDKRGRNWLHLCASVNVSSKPSSGATMAPGARPADRQTASSWPPSSSSWAST